MHQIKVAIIADDLTGAMDAAAPFARRKLNVHVVINSENLDTDRISGADILSINTNSRHLTAEKSSAVIDRVVSQVSQLNPDVLLFKKIDSTLRGNVVEESLAAYRAAQMPSTIFCPALPAQGRSFENGQVYIDGVLLKETAIGKDERAAADVRAVDVLFSQTSIHENVFSLSREDYSELVTGAFHIVGAKTESDLNEIVTRGLALDKKTMFIGAAGLTEALAQNLFGNALESQCPEILQKQAVFAVGSRTPEVARQLKQLLSDHPEARYVPVIDAQPVNSLVPGHSSDNTKALVLHATQSSQSQALDPDKVATAMAFSCEQALIKNNVDLLVATGGDTAMAILDRYSISVIRVEGEVLPGIVYSRVETPEISCWLVTKAGGFGPPSLFTDLLDYWYKNPVISAL